MQNLKINQNPNNNPAFFPNSVGQLDKTHFPTLKPNTTNDLSVRRHENKNPHTPTHAGEFITFDSQKDRNKRHFQLNEGNQKNFIQTIPQIFSHLNDLKVVFHNTDYVEQIFDTYYKIHALLFLDWVQTFAIIRSSSREHLLENVIQTTEEDFLTAFQLLKLQAIKPTPKPQKQNKIVLIAIKKYFPNEPFTSRDIEEKTLINRITISNYLLQFKEEGKIQRVRKKSRLFRYKLI